MARGSGPWDWAACGQRERETELGWQKGFCPRRIWNFLRLILFWFDSNLKLN
jgi:hypothetical protein